MKQEPPAPQPPSPIQTDDSPKSAETDVRYTTAAHRGEAALSCDVWLIASFKLSKSIGFVRCTSKPASRLLRTSLSMPKPLIAIARTRSERCLSLEISSRPEPSGSPMSLITRSNCVSFAVRNALPTLSAVVT